MRPADWHRLDQNLAAARDWVAYMTRLQMEHHGFAHGASDECRPPCSSPDVISRLHGLPEEAVRLVLHMLICDAAAIIRNNQ